MTSPSLIPENTSLSLFDQIPNEIFTTIAPYLINTKKVYLYNPERAFFCTSKRFSLLEADFFISNNEAVNSLLTRANGDITKIHSYFFKVLSQESTSSNTASSNARSSKTFEEITSLNLTGMVLKESQVSAIISCFSKLRILSLSNCSLTSTALQTLGSLPQLTSLSLSLNQDIKTFSFLPTGLEYLDLGRCSISVNELQILANGSHLKSIALNHNNGTLSGNAIASALKPHEQLTDLKLSGHDLRETFDRGNTKLLQIATNHPLLERLDFEDCKGLDETRMAELEPLKHLISLNLTSTDINDTAIDILTENHPKIEELYLTSTSITNEGLRFVARLEKLKTLDLSNCGEIDDDGLQYLVGKLPQLQKLILNGCEKLTQNGFNLIPTFSTLRSLEITNGSNDETLPLSSHFNGKLPELEELTLRNFDKAFNDKKEELVLASFSKLKRLTLSKSPRAMKPILEQLPHLEYLDLNLSSVLNNTSLTDIAKILPNLRYLSINGYKDKDLITAISSLKNLVTFALSDCIISKEERAKLQKILPSTEIIINSPMTRV